MEKEKFWDCGQCGESPMSYDRYVYCICCEHRRCECCSVWYRNPPRDAEYSIHTARRKGKLRHPRSETKSKIENESKDDQTHTASHYFKTSLEELDKIIDPPRVNQQPQPSSSLEVLDSDADLPSPGEGHDESSTEPSVREQQVPRSLINSNIPIPELETSEFLSIWRRGGCNPGEVLRILEEEHPGEKMKYWKHALKQLHQADSGPVPSPEILDNQASSSRQTVAVNEGISNTGPGTVPLQPPGDNSGSGSWSFLLKSNPPQKASQYRVQPRTTQDHSQPDFEDTASQQSIGSMVTSRRESSSSQATQQQGSDFMFAPPSVPGGLKIPQQYPFVPQRQQPSTETALNERTPKSNSNGSRGKLPVTTGNDEVSDESSLPDREIGPPTNQNLGENPLENEAYEQELAHFHGELRPILPTATILERNQDAEKMEDMERDDMSDESEISVSSVASIADSLFSVLTGSSISSIAGFEVAGEKLVHLLLSDDIIKQLCVQGLRIVASGRFERNLRRLLNSFAVDLKKESKTQRERHAAHFVRRRARNSAHMVCNKLKPREPEKRTTINHAETEELSESSDSTDSEDTLDDLQEVEAFIKSSNALDRLRGSLKAFIYPQTVGDVLKEPFSREQDVHLEKNSDESSHINEKYLASEVEIEKEAVIQGVGRSTMATVALMFRRRQQVASGKTRIEWHCKCGHKISDDFIELQPGAAQRLRQQLVRSADTRSSSEGTYVGKLAGRLYSGIQNLQSLLTTGSRKCTENGLPLHATSISNNQLDTQPNQPQLAQSLLPELLFLLICYSEGRYATKLIQLDLITQKTLSDKCLFKLLQKTYHSKRKRWVSCLSLRTLESIKFVHFEMYRSALVDVRKLDDIPPPEHNEYRYQPAPPDVIPPIGENHLKHLFHHPDHAEDDPICLNRFPKKLKERLKCTTGVNPGWGVQFIEGWNWKRIWVLAFAFFGMGSLLIGILWAVYGHSIQNAFAISSYMLALATVSVGTLQALLVM